MAPTSNHKMGIWVGRALSTLIVVCAIVLGFVVVYHTNRYPRTDDCEIFADFIGIAPQVEGPLVRLNVKDNQFVKKGDLLFEIDDRPYRYALEKTISEQATLEGQISDEGRIIAAKVSAVSVAEANIHSMEADVNRWAAAVDQAKADVANAEEAVGRPITIVIPQDRRDEERTILTRIRRGERIEHFETVRQRKHGSLIVVSLTVSPVKNAEGKIVGASKIARDITEQKRNRDHIATLAREAEHRSKNLLANVQAAVHLSKAGTVEGLKEAIEGRIQALANVTSLFVESRWIGAELSAIAARELEPYSTADGRRVAMNGPQILLEPDVAQAIAVTLHELATNAAKYGALSVADGRLELRWSHETDGQLQLRWTEIGGPPVQEPTRRGFGRRIIEQLIAQLKGKTQFDWRAEGLVCEISLRA